MTVPDPATGGTLPADLFVDGEFTAHSGNRLAFKINCDALTDEDLATCARQLAHRLPAFGSVEGVPTGGLRLADAMAKYVTTGPLLIVDDVLTTGGSMEEHRAGRDAIGAVLFARGPLLHWVNVALFALTSENVGAALASRGDGGR